MCARESGAVACVMCRTPCEGLFVVGFEGDHTAGTSAALMRQHEQQQMVAIEAVPDEAVMGDQDACVVCLERRPAVRLEPCGHIALCNECARLLQQSNAQPHCPMCRQVFWGGVTLTSHNVSKEPELSLPDYQPE